jgi:hypothetical protein
MPGLVSPETRSEGNDTSTSTVTSPGQLSLPARSSCHPGVVSQSTDPAR